MEGRMRQKRRHTGDRGTLRRTSTENPCHLVSAEIRAAESIDGALSSPAGEDAAEPTESASAPLSVARAAVWARQSGDQ
jgi:hypothetical protein